MITLSPKQRRELRAQAHALHPVVSVGQHGLTPQVVHEIDVALRAHALVKVRVFSEDRAEREAMLSQIAEALEAAPVQHLGKVLILWRPLDEAPAKAPQRRAKKAGGRRTSGKAKAPRERTGHREDSAVTHRRTAGAHRAEGLDGASPDVRRRRRRATTGLGAPKPAAASVRRKPDLTQDGARAARGKSAPNPRRRRTT